MSERARITSTQMKALRWIAVKQPIGWFPVEGPTLTVVRALAKRGLLNAINPVGGVGLVKYELSDAGHTAISQSGA